MISKVFWKSLEPLELVHQLTDPGAPQVQGLYSILSTPTEQCNNLSDFLPFLFFDESSLR